MEGIDKPELGQKFPAYRQIAAALGGLVCRTCVIDVAEQEGSEMVNKLDEALRFQQTALSLRAARQELLASNIANADTPNYKAKDIDFAHALQNALTGASASLQASKTSSAHLGGNADGATLAVPELYRKPVQPSADGNTVDMDVERAQFADNALRYEASVKFVSEKFKSIFMAIQG